MTRRTISDRDISLIKAMLDREMPNKDIQFFFNRPERPVNSGRISTIRTGTYSNAVKILPATNAELEEFFKDFERNQLGIAIRGQTTPITELSWADRAKSLFEQRKKDQWHLTAGETDECECKLDFDPRKMAPVVRAVAALANHKGGFIFFGIENGDHRACGIGDEFEKTDIVKIIERVKAHLSPTPNISAKQVISVGKNRVGFLRIDKHEDRPVIVYRDGETLNEGDILFRYPGQSSRIKFGDLRSILDQRDRRAQIALAEAATKVADVGTANTLILDTEKNVIRADNGKAILIDEKLARTLKFIKDGEFDEKAGSPTLKLIGDVSPTTITAPAKISLQAIFQERILDDFLTQKHVEQPLQYIQAGLAQSRLWLPLFYYVRIAKRTRAQIVASIDDLKISQKGKKKILIERLERRRSAYTKAATYSTKKIADEISKGVLKIPKTAADAVLLSNAITTIQETALSLEQLLVALRRSKELVEESGDANALSAVFKAACRLDEMFCMGA